MWDSISLVIHDGRTYRCSEFKLVVADTGYEEGMGYLVRLTHNEQGPPRTAGDTTSDED